MLDGRSSNEVLPAVYLQDGNKRNKDEDVKVEVSRKLVSFPLICSGVSLSSNLYVWNRLVLLSTEEGIFSKQTGR